MTDPDATDTAKHLFVPSPEDSCICDECGEHETWHRGTIVTSGENCQSKERPRSKCFTELLTAAQELMYDSALVSIAFSGKKGKKLGCGHCGAEVDQDGNPTRHYRDCKVGRLQDAVHAYIGYGDDDD